AAPRRAARACGRSTPARSVPRGGRDRPGRRTRRPSRVRAGRSFPRSGTRIARGPGTARAPPRTSSSSGQEFYRRVIRQDARTCAPPLDGPRERLRGRQAADEDLVDAVGERGRETRQPLTAEVEVAADDHARLVLDEGEHPLELPVLAGDVRVRDEEVAVEADAVHDPAEPGLA